MSVQNDQPNHKQMTNNSPPLERACKHYSIKERERERKRVRERERGIERKRGRERERGRSLLKMTSSRRDKTSE